jgi:hypothetical protein
LHDREDFQKLLKELEKSNPRLATERTPDGPRALIADVRNTGR